MLLEKDFEGVLWTILIQDDHRTRKLDSRSHRSRFDCCAPAPHRRLFQQHRPMACPASSKSRDSTSNSGMFGSRSTAITEPVGTSWCSIPSSLAASATLVKTTPVTLPP